MTAVMVTYTLLLLGGIAALGVLSPRLRRRPLPRLESSADPLEERRRVLLLTIADLDRALENGAIEPEQHAVLRLESESRLGRLLTILDERASDPAVGGEERPTPLAAKRVPRWAAVATVIAVAAVPLSVTLRAAIGDRSSALAFTGDAASTDQSADADDGYSFFEAEVAENPRDKRALLDLAHRYLDGGRIQDSITTYLSVVELDPSDPEARAHLGFVLFMSGRPQQGLRLVEAALAKDPGYPEALFFKGAILATAFDEPTRARRALRSYLRTSPFGSERERARMLLRRLSATAQAEGRRR